MGRRKMKPNNFKIAKNTQEWWGFTLQRGHAFGLYQPEVYKRGTCYVSGGEPDSRHMNCIVAYKRLEHNPNYYRWEAVSVFVGSDLGRLILQTLKDSPYDGVIFRPERSQAVSHWKPMPANYQQKKGLRKEFHPVDGIPCKYDSTPWRPNFPTFQTRRPDTTPPLTRPAKAKTWVDRICANAAI